jgi:predicted  nucleic acid-binding Zn-ribbon protein
MTLSIETVVELHEVLTELEAERLKLSGLPAPLQELEKELEQLATEITGLESTLAEADSTRRAAELEASARLEKVEHYQGQISKVTTQREYGALLSEIDTMNVQRKAHEEEALAALERHEQATRSVDEMRTSRQELDADYRSQLAEWDEQKPAAEERIQRLEAQAAVLRERLPRAALQLFERLRTLHDGDPMAQVIKVERPGSGPIMYRCKVCNYSVRPQAVVQIQTAGELIVCDCGRQRIFYL